MMKAILLVLSLILGFNAQAERVDGFLELQKDYKIYIDYTPAKGNQPTVVLLNGLTYSTRQWEKFAQALTKKGIGVLRYDMFGMGQTLLKYAPMLEAIPYQAQVEDLEVLLNKLGIEKPYNILGLSYGGGIAMAFAAKRPWLVGKIMLMAPYTEPLKNQHDWINSQIWYTRKTFPLNPASDDELYDFFLRQIVYTTYPSAEPVVLENPFKLEATFRMVQGIRKWTSGAAVKKLPVQTVHLMIAGKDQYVPREIMNKFWNSIPKKAQMSQVIMNNSEHKIPEAIPNFAASWVAEILDNNELLAGGRKFEADPYSGVVKYEGGSLKLPKEK